MDVIRNDSYLKIPSDAIENIRKIHNLDKPGRLEEAIKILHDWIQKQDHIVKKDFSKYYLETTLITCKGSVEKAKKQIDRLCTMKTLMPNFFLKTNAKMELQDILKVMRAVPLPKLTEDNNRILVVEFRDLKNITSEIFLQYYQFSMISWCPPAATVMKNPQPHSSGDVDSIIIMSSRTYTHTLDYAQISEYLKANDYANGFIVIYDYRDTNLFELVTKISTVELQQYVSILIEGYGARLKELHYLTDSKAVELLVTIMKQLVSEKIGSRLHIRKTLEDLHKVLPKEILPVEYGGNERSIAKLHEELIEELSSEKHVEYMKMMNKACSDETKRHAGKFNEEYMGMPGAFRNLSVD